MLMGNLWGEVTANPAGTEIYIYPGLRRASVPVERGTAALVLYRTAFILAKFAEQDGSEIRTETRATEGDVGLPWPLIAAAAIVSVGQAVAIGYCAFKAAEVVDRHLARKAELRRLVQDDTEFARLVREHNDREDKAGKPMPLSAATKAGMDRLVARQEALAKQNSGNWGPLSSGLPSLPTLAAGTGGFTLGAVAAGAFAIWLLMFSNKH
jgi:hypothetical protein